MTDRIFSAQFDDLARRIAATAREMGGTLTDPAGNEVDIATTVAPAAAAQEPPVRD